MPSLSSGLILRSLFMLCIRTMKGGENFPGPFILVPRQNPWMNHLVAFEVLEHPLPRLHDAITPTVFNINVAPCQRARTPHCAEAAVRHVQPTVRLAARVIPASMAVNPRPLRPVMLAPKPQSSDAASSGFTMKCSREKK